MVILNSVLSSAQTKEMQSGELIIRIIISSVIIYISIIIMTITNSSNTYMRIALLA